MTQPKLPQRFPSLAWAALFVLVGAACGSQQTPDDNTGGAGSTSTPDASAGTGGASTAGTGGSAGQAAAGQAGGFQDAAPPGGDADVPGVYNARDTGGWTTASGQTVRHNVLIRSGHLADVDASGCQRLTDLHVHSVLDLRAASAAASQPDATCVVSSTDHYLADLPKILPPSAQSYAQTLDAVEPKLAAMFEHLAAENGLPAIVHCVIGRDRASLVTAILLLSLGVPQDQVVTDFTTNQDPSVTVDAAWLQPLFERVSSAGSIEAYLAAHGVSQSQIDALRSMALE